MLGFRGGKLSRVPAIVFHVGYAKIDKLRRRPNYLTEQNKIVVIFFINFASTISLRQSRDLVSILLFSIVPLICRKSASIMDIIFNFIYIFARY